MSRLVRAELRRVAARRLFRLSLVLTIVAIVIGGVAAFATTASLSEANYQHRVRVAAARQRAEETHVRACLRASGVASSENVPRAVAAKCFPQGRIHAHDPRFHRDRLKSILQGVAGVLAIVGWGLGASFVGAEFASRGMTTLLTWEPRRLRVLVAKAVVVIVAVAVFAASALLAVALAMLPALLAHGAPAQAGAPTWATFAGVIGRGALLAAVAAGIGFAIATLGRNTAVALGAGFAYIIVLENILGNSLRAWRAWLLLGNAIVFVSGVNGGDVPGRSVAGAGVFLAAVSFVLLGAAAWAFRVRDVA